MQKVLLHYGAKCGTENLFITEKGCCYDFTSFLQTCKNVYVGKFGKEKGEELLNAKINECKGKDAELFDEKFPGAFREVKAVVEKATIGLLGLIPSFTELSDITLEFVEG